MNPYNVRVFQLRVVLRAMNKKNGKEGKKKPVFTVRIYNKRKDDDHESESEEASF